jgi:hypothetical protein
LAKTKHNTRNPFHRKSEAQMGQGENRPKAQKIEKKKKKKKKKQRKPQKFVTQTFSEKQQRK